MTLKTIKKWEGLPEGDTQLPSAEQEAVNKVVEPSSPQEEATKNAAIELESNSVKYSLQLVEEALELSRKGSFCTVSFDYSQLEFLHRSLKVAELRSNQLSQVLDILRKRKDAFKVLVGNLTDVLQGVQGQLNNLEKVIPEVEIK
jgi:hypothetical protein